MRRLDINAAQVPSDPAVIEACTTAAVELIDLLSRAKEAKAEEVESRNEKGRQAMNRGDVRKVVKND